MTAIPKYIAMVADGVKWGMEDPTIAATLADKAGIERGDIEALTAPLNDVENAWNAAQSVAAPKAQATQDLLNNFDAVKAEVVELRQMIKNVLSADGTLLIALGLNTKQPDAQDEFLAYSVRAFTNAQTLSDEQRASLAKRKWDAARFEAALNRARAAQADNDRQEGAKAAAKAATDDLYNKLDALDALYRPFAKEARRVLAQLPGALDKMQLTAGVPPKPARPVPNHDRKPKPVTAGG